MAVRHPHYGCLSHRTPLFRVVADALKNPNSSNIAEGEHHAEGIVDRGFG
jgi:hypothetical protein